MAIEIPPPRKVGIIVSVGLLISITLISIGSFMLCDKWTLATQSHVVRYDDKCYDDDTSTNCTGFIPHPSNLRCTCYLPFELKDELEGEITLYYELPGFDQNNKTYAVSRDDNQLTSGKPSEEPAASCGNFSYSEDTHKPIFPCGEVADSMFSDIFVSLTRIAEPDVKFAVSYPNLLTADTPKFKNPTPEELEKFAMPKGWLRREDGTVLKPWEQSDPKGVENPAFRAWMNPKLKRKPVLRIKPEPERRYGGLQAGNYRMKIFIYYGADRYNGVRNFVLEGKFPVTVTRNLPVGIIFVTLALGTMLAGGVYLILLNKKAKKSDSRQQPSSDDREEPLLNRIRNRLNEWRAS